MTKDSHRLKVGIPDATKGVIEQLISEPGFGECVSIFSISETKQRFRQAHLQFVICGMNPLLVKYKFNNSLPFQASLICRCIDLSLRFLGQKNTFGTLLKTMKNV